MKKIAIAVVTTLTLVLCFALSACGIKYRSHYSSSQMTEIITSNEASVSFDSFSGTYVIKLQNSGEAFITYNATLKDCLGYTSPSPRD